jgi:preprotein translocase subunit SecB
MTEQAQPIFNIEKIYVKDLSIEVPGAPKIFLEPDAPQLDVQVGSQGEQIGEDAYQCVLTITVTAKIKDKIAFLVEVQQAGVFRIQNLPAEAMEPTLMVACPNILFPYGREAVSDAVIRAGFPPLLLQPVNFEATYLQQKQQASS